MRELRSEGHIYKIEKLLGQGQSATVFKAVREDRQGHSRQTVALKLLKDSASVSWLRREFETLAKIESKHCVRALGWENLGQNQALVLEWIDGLNLYELCQYQSLGDEFVDEIVAQIQEGLRVMHENGLYHGDLSPKNILIDRDGRIRIVDFASEASAGGLLRGTPEYLAPELWMGAKTGRETDIFALGLIEVDLRSCLGRSSNGPSMPLGHKECEARANQLATSSNGMLALQPEQRELCPVLLPNPKTQARLAVFVNDAMESRLYLETALLPSQRPTAVTTFPRVAVSVLLAWLTMMTSVSAQAPSKADRSPSAALSVSSHSWVRIAINGRWAGYSPLQIKGLRPGLHRISWQGQAGTGETVLHLESGTVKKLTEKDFERQAASRRH